MVRTTGAPLSLVYPRRRTHLESVQHPGLTREEGGILTSITGST